MKIHALAALLPLLMTAKAGEKETFRLIFNGRDLAGWTGDGFKTEADVLVSDGGGKSMLETANTYTAYILDFDFKTEGDAKASLVLHYSGESDGSGAGIEILLGNDAAGGQPHGSLAKLMVARPGVLKPAGEWNNQRVTVTGSNIRIAVNGAEILDADLDALLAGNPDHGGLNRRAGEIVFKADGSKLSLRNVNILEIVPKANEEAARDAGFKPLFNGKDLEGWKYETDGTGNWFVANGILKHTGEPGITKDLWTVESFKDFTMVFDWRWAETGEGKTQPVILPDGNEKIGDDGEPELVEINELDSGIYLRGDSTSQVNLWNWPIGSGEVYGYRTNKNNSPEIRAAVTPKRKADAPPGEWNRMMITIEGKSLAVSLNGVVVIENATLGGIPDEGPIGLQHHGQAIEFSNIWVKALD